ncbi:MAG TPA: hypothetical protein VGG33_00700 [Polyangia bacterium]
MARQTERNVSGGISAVIVTGVLFAGAGAMAAPPAALATGQAPPPAAATERTFESLAQAAVPAPNADALVAPFSEDCERSRREIDRARCRGTQSFLRAKLPEKLMSTVVDSTRVVSVSAYDAAVRGLRVSLVGCLTCDDAARGPEAEPYYVTFAVPGSNAASLRDGVILGQATFPVANPTEAKAFEANVKPHLRAEFLFRGEGKAWKHKGQRGVAFPPVGMRIFNRCTGEVLFSQPQSAAHVNVVKGLAGCEGPSVAKNPASTAASGSTTTVARDKEDVAAEPEKLGARELGDALKATREAIVACDSQYKTRGTVDIELDLAGTGGTAQAVRTKGRLGGTQVAECVGQAVRSVQFPRFQQSRQTVSYQVRLEGK